MQDEPTPALATSKPAAPALHESEAQFRAIANLVPDLLWRHDAQGNVTWCNQPWADYTGQALADATAGSWLAVVHPDDRAQARRFRAAASQGQQLRLRHASGDYQWFQLRAARAPAERGRRTEWLGAATHLQQRHPAGPTTLESRDLLQSMFDTSLVAMSVLQAVRDENGELTDFKILLANKELERQTGRTDLVGKYYAAEYPGIRPTGLFDLMSQALATGRPTGMEYYYGYEDLNQWFSCQFVKLDDGLVATNLDITERKLAEQEHTLNLGLLEQAEQVAGMGSWDYEMATGAFRWSAGMYRLFGLAPGTPIAPETYLDFVVPDDRAIAERLVGHLRTGSAGFEKTLRIAAKAQVKTLRLRAIMLYNAQGQPLRMLGVDLDITALKHLEADNLHLRLGQQQERLTAVLAAQEEERRRIAESLHNGLSQLLYATKLQLDSLALTPEQPAQAEAARLLTEAMREARSISHELTPTIITDFGLDWALHDICRGFNSPGLHWQCVVQLDAEYLIPQPLQVAVYRLAQELAQNVLKHAQATQAWLEVDVLPSWVTLRVEDNGRGFEHSSATTGIGLKTLRERVALLDGSVDITATPGEGSEIQIRLPLPTAVTA
jgi:PAS domain S-box-containing protein